VRALVTGASGLAGGWLCRACVEAGDEVIGVSRSGTVPDAVCEGVALDLADAQATAALVARRAPDVVFHLAALSSVGRSWDEPAETLAGNVGGAVSLLSAIRDAAPDAHLVWVSSCEVYGAPSLLPTPEPAPYAPANPYAVSKAAGEMLADVFARSHGLRVTCARPYSHAGPRQRPMFVLSNLARQGAIRHVVDPARVRASEAMELRVTTPS
jgi:nucleoside-diphosphate-sugar epimerase